MHIVMSVLSRTAIGSPPVVAAECRSGMDPARFALDYKYLFEGMKPSKESVASGAVLVSGEHFDGIPLLFESRSGIVFRCAAKIGAGSFGLALRYDARGRLDLPRSIVVKVARASTAWRTHETDDERAFRLLHEKGHTLYPWCTGRTATCAYVLMPTFDGDLFDLAVLRQRLSLSSALNVTRQIAQQLLALEQAGLGYLDIKAENCLYSACGAAAGARVHVALGDFGSIGRLGDALVHTNVPPEDRRLGGVPYSHARVLWCLAALLLTLLRMPTDFMRRDTRVVIMFVVHNELPAVLKHVLSSLMEPLKPGTRLATLPDAVLLLQDAEKEVDEAQAVKKAQSLYVSRWFGRA